MNKAFSPVRKIQQSQHFMLYDDASSTEIDFGKIPLMPNQMAYMMDCRSAEMVEVKGNSKLLFGNDNFKRIDQLYNIIKPDNVERFTKEILANFKFIFADPKRTKPYRNVFSSIYELKKGDSYKSYLRQTFTIRSDQNGIITHTGGIYTELQDFQGTIKPSVCVIGPDAIYFDHEFLRGFDSLLSKRELEILKFISQGYKTCQIAERLFISKLTVSTHRKNMIKKLEAHNTPHLVCIAKDIGLI